MIKKSGWILMGFLFLCSCGDDGSCVTGEVDIKDLEQFGCINTTFQLTVNSGNDFELIRNQAEYDQIISGPCRPQIDWQSYDLIAGMKALTQGIASVQKALLKDCLNNQLTFRVTYNLNETRVAPVVSFNALIPKLGNDENLFVEIIVNR